MERQCRKICNLTGEDTSLHGLVEALRKRHDYFVSLGAKTSDHGLLEPYGLEISEKEQMKYLKGL